MTVALAGRRIDATGNEVSSFPLENVGRVRRELRALLTRLRPDALISSAACGADLLALDEAGALGIRRRIVLPFDSALFLESSVLDRPGEWRSVYQRAIQEVSANGDLLVIGSDAEGETSYLIANEAILDEAFELAAASDGQVTAVLVWDGRPRGAGDLTEAFRADAQKRGCEVMEVSTIPMAATH